MKLYIARDQIFNRMYLHTQLPKLVNKLYASNGVCFEPSVEIAERFKDLKPEDGAKEIVFISEVDLPQEKVKPTYPQGVGYDIQDAFKDGYEDGYNDCLCDIKEKTQKGDTNA